MADKLNYDRRQFHEAAVLPLTAAQLYLTESVDSTENDSDVDIGEWLLNNGYSIGYHNIVPRCAPLSMFYLWEI